MKSLLIGIKNLIKYFNVIFNDRNYDNLFLEIMMHKKMSLMLEHLTNFSFESKQQAQAIKALQICIAILDRRIHCKYYTLWSRGERHLDKIHNIEKRDWRIFCQLLEKYSDWWWD
jgi:hypothetical protein